MNSCNYSTISILQAVNNHNMPILIDITCVYKQVALHITLMPFPLLLGARSAHEQVHGLTSPAPTPVIQDRPCAYRPYQQRAEAVASQGIPTAREVRLQSGHLKYWANHLLK